MHLFAYIQIWRWSTEFFQLGKMMVTLLTSDNQSIIAKKEVAMLSAVLRNMLEGLHYILINFSSIFTYMKILGNLTKQFL